VTILSWWRDRRERHAALAEMEQLRLHDEAVLMDQSQNPLNLATLCASTGDLAEAARQWELARARTPNAVLKSEDSLTILLALKRFDEAEELMWQRQKRSRWDRETWVALAQIAEHRGDVPEALKRWRAVRSRVLDTTEGFEGSARCLMKLGRLDEAEKELNQARMRDPMGISHLIGLARLSDQRKDWVESVERWKVLAETHADPPAFANVAIAMIELGKFDEADAYLREPSLRFTNNVEIAATRADVAYRRGDLAEACDRWARVRLISPYSQSGYRQGAERLVEAGRHEEADAVARAACEHFPAEAWPLRDYAKLAHDRRDWPEAIARWAAFRERFPEDAEANAFGAEALKASGLDDAAAALLPRP
jgi:tetratricopeptide (TPR) repeat protein